MPETTAVRTPVVPVPRHASRKAPPGTGFRPEIQGLRAVAVGLVVLFHLWPNRLTGGYVGVDVFFVISGFLITAHIDRELLRTGTVSLRQFWARRIRRLLPASLLVLAVSAGAVVALVPATTWQQTARQIAASALYVQNWALAADAVDYMAADNVPTVAQHYWSLSIEEQFYLVWPVLLLGLFVVHRGAVLPRRAIVAGGLAGLVLASLAYSVWATSQDRSQAYFVTPTRVWEFGAGGLLALLASGGLRGHRWRAPVAWAGLAAIVYSGVGYDDATLFPGWTAAVPVLGTVAVIAAGTTPPRGIPVRWLAAPPMRFVGDISYSVYLWHWPLVVVWPYATGTELRTTDKLAIGLLTLLVAWACKVFVEDPARGWRALTVAPWRTYVAAAVAMAVVVGVGSVITWEVDGRATRAAARSAVTASEDCLGPGALDPANGCGTPEGTGDLVPPPEVVVEQNTEPLYRGCQAGIETAVPTSCDLGAPAATADRTIALVGDSHATQWFPAFDHLGSEKGWRVMTYAKSSCPFTYAHRLLSSEQTDVARTSCETWRDAVLAELLASDVDAVVTAAYSTAYSWAAQPQRPLRDPRVDGFTTLWSELTAAGIHVVVLSDVPRTLGGNVPNCLAAHPDDRNACAVPREEALPGSAVVVAAEKLRDDPGVLLLDLDDRFCDATTCHAVVGDMIVYRDYSHLSAQYATALVPWIAPALERVLGS